MDKNRKRIEHMWAELLADFFDNDVFFDVMEEKMHSRIMPNERNMPHLKPFTAKSGHQVVGEAISPVGPNSFSVAPIIFDESALDPKRSDEDDKETAFREEAEMDEMSEKEINEHEKEKD